VILAVVVAVAFVVGLFLVLAEDRTTGPLEAPSHWVVRMAPRPLRRWIDTTDRHVTGGAAVALSLLVIFGTAAVIGVLLDSIDNDGAWSRWDRAAAEWSSEHATDTSTTVLDAITQLGGTGYLLLVMGIVGVAAGRHRRSWGPIAYLATVGLGVSLLNNGLKWIIDRDRPDVDPLSSFAGSSFPSGHSAAAAACWAAIAVVVAGRASRPVRRASAYLAVVVAAAVAATRVLLGVHWFSDTLAGLLIGWTWWFLVTVAFGGRWLRIGAPLQAAAHDELLDDPTKSAPRPQEATRCGGGAMPLSEIGQHHEPRRTRSRPEGSRHENR
jgi:membrane-associated phospholipid phosphatase